jgi:hypothetical protein
LTEQKSDLPFYNGMPVALSLRQWMTVLGFCLAGFFILALPLPLFMSPYGQFIPASLFMFLPLYGLHRVAPGHVGALFRRIGWRELWLMPAFALLNLFASVTVALIVASFFTVSINPAAELLMAFSTSERVLFLLRTLPQLLGEELITILPFLALLSWLAGHLGWSRRRALIVAWVLSSLLFGLLHLPTYSWNIAQSLLIIGAARMVLTGAYLYTGNLWVCTGAHVISNWIIFFIAMAMSAQMDAL